MQSTTVVHERRWLWLALLAVFALHNAEEWRGGRISLFRHCPPSCLPRLYAPEPWLATMLVLTLAQGLCAPLAAAPRGHHAGSVDLAASQYRGAMHA